MDCVGGDKGLIEVQESLNYKNQAINRVFVQRIIGVCATVATEGVAESLGFRWTVVGKVNQADINCCAVCRRYALGKNFP